jgi:iron complex outermembrane receptor protein
MFLLVTAIAAIAQTGRIKGRIMNAETGSSLAAANILLTGTTLGTSSKTDGSYELANILPGSYQIVVSYVGFARAERYVLIRADQTVSLDVALVPAVLPGQTIVVTATRGRERETPVTFSTFEAKELAARYNTQDIPQLLSELPSTTFYSENGNGIGYNYLNIRGFDQRRISVMINGIPQNDPEDHNVYWLDFPDLASNLQDIQVQRGAGSAFYGPAAIGGSVNLITSSFSANPRITLYGGMGSYNTRKYLVNVQSGLVENRYAVQARLSRIRTDGYKEKAWSDFSGYFLSAVRYDESMTTQVNFYGGPIADGLGYTGIPKSDAKDKTLRRKNYSYWEPGYFVERRPEEIENFNQPHYELLHEWRVSEDVTVNNTVFLVTGEGFFDYDGSWAPYSYYRITPANGFNISGDSDTLYIPNALIRAWVGNKQYGWLPRATIRHRQGELTVGSEFRMHRSLHWGSLRWGENLPSGVTPDYRYYEYRGGKDIVSLYAHELFRLRSDITLMLNIQYAYNKYRLHDERYIGTDFTIPYHFLNPRLGLNYNITDRINLYAQVSRTSREPRLKNLYDAAEASTPPSWGVVEPQFEPRPGGGYDFARPLVRPEVLTDVEVGGGYSTAGFRATANFFLMNFRDEIVKSGQLDRFGQPVTGNAEKTRHIGVEFTATAAAGPLEFHGNLTVSRNRLVRYVVYDGTGGAQSLDGNAIAGFPDLIANARLSYSSNTMKAAVSMQHVGEFYTDNFQNPDDRTPDPERTVDAYTVFNGWLSYAFSIPGGTLAEARLQVNNLFDTRYLAHGEGRDFFPAAPRNVFVSLQITL